MKASQFKAIKTKNEILDICESQFTKPTHTKVLQMKAKKVLSFNKEASGFNLKDLRAPDKLTHFHINAFGS